MFRDLLVVGQRCDMLLAIHIVNSVEVARRRTAVRYHFSQTFVCHYRQNAGKHDPADSSGMADNSSTGTSH